MDMIWGKDGEGHGIRWLGAHVNSADGLCLSPLMPIQLIYPPCSGVLSESI